MARKRKERNEITDTLLGGTIGLGVIILFLLFFTFILAKCCVVTNNCEEQKAKQEVTSILNIHN